jgi:hypothetical protein
VELTSPEVVLEAARRFELHGAPAHPVPVAGGLINGSWRIEAGGNAWLIQQLNRHVFRDIDALMRNVKAITSHLGWRLATTGVPDLSRGALQLVPTTDGESWMEDDEGRAWRCFAWIPGTVTRTEARTPAEAAETGRAFGEFTALLGDFTAPLAHTIPGFHHTATRVSALELAFERDVAGRAAGVEKEMELLRELAPLAHILPPLLAADALPQRPAHNDSKIANVLFDAVDGRALTVIDLDTVMPGTALHDIGDLIRSTVGSAPEDVADPKLMRVRTEYFTALVRGWLTGADEVLIPLERELIVTAGRILTFEQTVRFLTDHLEGDRYYSVTHPGHNLDRTRAQLALLLDLTAREEELEEIVATCTSRP